MQNKASQKARPLRQRFLILPFTNSATGSTSYRVSGIKRNGERIRENFADPQEAKFRQAELESEYQSRTGTPDLRATWLSEDQIHNAEACYKRLDADEDLLTAVDHWLRHGQPKTATESPRLDEAVETYLKWLANTTELRPKTKVNQRTRVKNFTTATPNVRVCDVTVDHIEKHLEGYPKPQTKNAVKNCLSSFFQWCRNGKRHWLVLNPCAGVEIEGLNQHRIIAILSVDDCRRLMRAAETYKAGALVPYLSLLLFGGVRPTEAQRLTWQQVNLVDGEITLRPEQTKTGKGRTVAISPTLNAWLTKYRTDTIRLPQHNNHFRAVKAQSKIKWTPDVLRHTCISHYFRRTGSYGFAAEQFGNSEAIIRSNYQGKVTSEETNQFYAILPKSMAQVEPKSNVVAMPPKEVAA